MAEKLWKSYTDFSGGINLSKDPELIADNEMQSCYNLIYNNFGQLQPRTSLSVYYDELVAGIMGFFIEYATKLFWGHNVRGFVEKENVISTRFYTIGVNWQNRLYLAQRETSGIFMLYGTTTNGVFTKKHEVLTGLPKPNSPTLAFNSTGGNLHKSSTGYSYIVTFYRQDTFMPYYVESKGSDVVQLKTTKDGSIDISNIPLMPSSDMLVGEGVINGRKIYRIGVSDDLKNNTADFSLVADIPNNIETTYNDNIADVDLGIAYDNDDNDRFVVGGNAKIYDMTVHQNRLFVVGESLRPSLSVAEAKNTISFSREGLPEYFPELNYRTVDPDDNDQIMRIVSFKNYLVIFKQRNIYLMTGTSEDSYNVELYCKSVGLRNPKCVAVSEYGIYFSAQDGIRLFDGSPETKLIDKTSSFGGRSGFHSIAYKKPRIVTDYKIYQFAFFDENINAWVLGSSNLIPSSNEIFEIFYRKSDGCLYFGLSNGKIIREDIQINEDFSISLKTKKYSMDDLAQWKQFYRLEPMFTGSIINTSNMVIAVESEGGTYTYYPFLDVYNLKTNLPEAMKGITLAIKVEAYSKAQWNNFAGFNISYLPLGREYGG